VVQVVESPAVNPYREYLKLVNEGQFNPEDIDIDFLIKEFQEKAAELDYYNLYLQAGMFLEAAGKLLRLKADLVHNQLVPEEPVFQKEEERKKYIKHQVEEILKDYDFLKDTELYDLFAGYRRKTGRKPGTSVKVNRLSYEEFRQLAKDQVKEVLVDSIDYNAYAKDIARRIRQGTFKIRKVQDFIGLMFAITFEGINVEDISQFL